MYGFKKIEDAIFPIEGLGDIKRHLLTNIPYYKGKRTKNVIIRLSTGKIYFRMQSSASNSRQLLYFGEIEDVARRIQLGCLGTKRR